MIVSHVLLTAILPSPTLVQAVICMLADANRLARCHIFDHCNNT